MWYRRNTPPLASISNPPGEQPPGATPLAPACATVFVHETRGATPLALARRGNPLWVRRVSILFLYETFGATPLALVSGATPLARRKTDWSNIQTLSTLYHNKAVRTFRVLLQ